MGITYGFKGKHYTPEVRKIISEKMLGEKHHSWKGDNVGKQGIHQWARNRLKDITHCENCGMKKRLDCANISENYLRDLSDWVKLCRRCHVWIDDNYYRRKDVGGRKNEEL